MRDVLDARPGIDHPWAGTPVAHPHAEAHLTKRTYGLLAGALALGAWWWNRNRTMASRTTRERGTVIFDNTPTATGLLDEGGVA